jgi:protein-disulfide isomerase
VYGDKVKVVWKNMPLSFHPNAMPAALAAMAANEQGKFWEFHDRVFANQQKMSRDQYLAYAKELKLDVAKFTQALDSGKFKPQIDADAADAKALGVSGTPAFFVNGKFLNGAKPFEDFATVINAELKRLNLPIPPGAPQS